MYTENGNSKREDSSVERVPPATSTPEKEWEPDSLEEQASELFETIENDKQMRGIIGYALDGLAGYARAREENGLTSADVLQFLLKYPSYGDLRDKMVILLDSIYRETKEARGEAVASQKRQEYADKLGKLIDTAWPVEG